MDRIAIISDIHGNIPALEAVLADINERGIQNIYCLGDLIGKGPEGEKAIRIVRDCCRVIVKGNWDDFITRETNSSVLQWHQQQLSPHSRKFLESLPFSKDVIMSGRKVRLYHASAESLYVRIQPWDSLEQKLAMFQPSELTGFLWEEPDIVGYGDVHQAFVQSFLGKTLFNSGSVGNPLDSSGASYAILEGNYNIAEVSAIGIQLIRVPYNIEKAIEIARKMDMPQCDEYIQELTTGKYRGLN
ncbi:metallophosphoesterase [Bacillus lacus]|uniref:Metallophosphoesterase n=1 Tax=Metabacillus lacus TaxID=1983721 RepID=A0A7X2J217_9BACI|nr:metallophosphoesterase family protein [Metabacillus lacus]MRX73869.1 metallophosphoesterase [Metabacillus lacus]